MPSTSLDTLVDVVDTRNRRVGSAKRRNLLPKKLNFRTVHIFVLDRDGNLILQKLRTDHLRNPSRFGSSVAGYLHAGERYASAAHRKLKDELGVNVPISKVGTFKMNDEGSSKFVGLFLARLGNQDVRFAPNQIDSIAHMSFKEIDKNIQRCPATYTPTFLKAYEFFRSRGHAAA